MLGFNLRWHRLLRRARESLRRRTLGPLALIRTVWTSGVQHHPNVSEWRKLRERGGGVLVEIAVHHFDLWHFLLDSETDEVFATSRSEQWDDETATVTARMANGVLASSLFSQSTSESNEVEIYGQLGRLLISCSRFDGLEYLSASSLPGDIGTRLRKIAHALKELPQGLVNLRRGGDFVASYRAEWRHFIASIQHDESVECTLEDGRRAIQVVLAAGESASLGRPVKSLRRPERLRRSQWTSRAESREIGQGGLRWNTGRLCLPSRGRPASLPLESMLGSPSGWSVGWRKGRCRQFHGSSRGAPTSDSSPSGQVL